MFPPDFFRITRRRVINGVLLLLTFFVAAVFVSRLIPSPVDTDEKAARLLPGLWYADERFQNGGNIEEFLLLRPDSSGVEIRKFSRLDQNRNEISWEGVALHWRRDGQAPAMTRLEYDRPALAPVIYKVRASKNVLLFCDNSGAVIAAWSRAGADESDLPDRVWEQAQPSPLPTSDAGQTR